MSDRILHRADALVERVRRIVTDDPAARAALRRGVGLAPDDPRMLAAHRIVAPYTTDEHPNTERAFYAVAAIMAAQPRDARDQGTADDEERATDDAPADQPPSDRDKRAADKKKRRNLGVSLAEAVAARGLNPDTTEQRLHLLARQNVDGVHRHLPRLVLHLRGDLVDVDWGVLVRDLSRWGHSPRQVAKEWTQGYHRTLETLRRREAAKTANQEEEETKAA